ncbi:MAG: OmpA family protein [Bacteroidales bacterium]|nr:OmpA family protein [Bacteroidales bacterium]
MKTIKLITAVVLTLSVSALSFAQKREKDHSNRDENGKIVRGPYLANSFGSNWFIDFGSGMNIYTNLANNAKGGFREALFFDFGKWVNPEFGARLGYHGFRGSENITNNVNTGKDEFANFQFAYIHADAMWNFSHTVWGYRRDRFWDFIPYAHFGVMRFYDNQISEEAQHALQVKYKLKNNEVDNEFAAGVGLLNRIYLCDRLYFTLDIRETLITPRYIFANTGHPMSNISILAGLMVEVSPKWWWDRGVSTDEADALADALKEAQDALADAKAKNEELAGKANDLENEKNKLADDIKGLEDKNKELADKADKAGNIYINDTTFITLKMGTEPCKVFFDKGSYKLSSVEKLHIDFYIQNILRQDPDHDFMLSGFADAGTGNDKINNMLCQRRAEVVKNYIMKTFGLDDDRIEILDAKVSSVFKDPRLDRSVVIEH